MNWRELLQDILDWLDISPIEWFCLAFIAACIWLLIWSAHYEESVTMPTAYAAWVKQTGNDRHLTYGEWHSLQDAERRNNPPQYIYIYH